MQWEVRSPRSPQTLIDTILLCHTGCMHGKEKLVCLFSDPSLLTFFGVVCKSYKHQDLLVGLHSFQ